jgi:hypothetical protein
MYAGPNKWSLRASLGPVNVTAPKAPTQPKLDREASPQFFPFLRGWLRRLLYILLTALYCELGMLYCHTMIREQSEGIPFSLARSSSTTSCTNLMESCNHILTPTPSKSQPFIVHSHLLLSLTTPLFPAAFLCRRSMASKHMNNGALMKSSGGSIT